MSIKQNQTLKQLQSRKAMLEVDAEQYAENMKIAQQRYAKANQQLINVNKEIDRMAVMEPTVSEHAIIRYLERAMGLDLENIKNEILTPTVTAQIKALGSGKYPIISGCKAVVKGTTVVSIVDK